MPTQMISSVVPGSKSSQVDPAQLQTSILRYADDFIGRTGTGIDAYAGKVNTDKARTKALMWKISLDSSALGIATGANPTANLVDFIALSSLTRGFLELQVTNAEPPGAFEIWLENSRVLETNAWKLADGVLTRDQQEEFRAAIGKWLARNATEGSGFLRRPQELASSIRQAGEREGKQPGSVFSFVGLDPTAGLDPAIREVTRTRLFAERALFASERMAPILGMQTELLTEQILGEEQITNGLASADRLSRAAESASQTAARLPDLVSSERKAILDALDSQEGKLRDLSAQVTQTLTAGEKMSSSLNATVISFDALMKRFGVGEPSTSPPDTNSPPFNILDYAHTANQIALMSQQLDALLKDASGSVDTPALDKKIAQLSAIVGQSKSDAKSVLNHAFLLIGGLIVLTFACAIVYRRLAPRARRTPDSSHS